jgi:hypothetical protein
LTCNWFYRFVPANGGRDDGGDGGGGGGGDGGGGGVGGGGDGRAEIRHRMSGIAW